MPKSNSIHNPKVSNSSATNSTLANGTPGPSSPSTNGMSGKSISPEPSAVETYEVFFSAEDLMALSSSSSDEEEKVAKEEAPNAAEEEPPKEKTVTDADSSQPAAAAISPGGTKKAVDQWVKGKSPAPRITALQQVQKLSGPELSRTPGNRKPHATRIPAKSTWKKGNPVRTTLVADVAELAEGEAETEEEWEFYEPAVGDEVMGVVKACRGPEASVDIGARKYALLLRKEAFPLDMFAYTETGARQLAFVPPEEGDESPFVPPLRQRHIIVDSGGKAELPGLLQNGNGKKDERKNRKNDSKPFVAAGSIVRVAVIGHHEDGSAMVSLRKVWQRRAWQRVQQIAAENEPIEVDIVSFNNGGCVAFIEGLRAFLPISGLLDSEPGVVPDPATWVGKTIQVMIKETDRNLGRLILSESEAAKYDDVKNFNVGAVVNCQVIKVLDYGAMLRILNSNSRGLLHVSNISRVHVGKAEEVFSEGEVIKALVLDHENGRYSFSTRDLESDPGLILREKEQVWEEAESMAAEFREAYADDITANLERKAAENSEYELLLSYEVEEEPIIANAEWLAFKC